MELYLLLYIVLLIIPFFISYKYATSIVKKSGLFLAPTVFALAMNLTFGVVVVLGWLSTTLFTFFEMAFFGGLFIGSIILIVSECILLVVLLLQKKKLLILYQKNLKTQLS